MKAVISFAGLLVLLASCQATNDIILSDVQSDDKNTADDYKSTFNHDHVENVEPFIPTKEWQVVKPNQPVPAGLHIRMNFQTGIKEAKLLEDDRNNEGTPIQESSVDPKSPKIIISEESKKIHEFPEKSSDKLYFTKTQLKEALHEFRDKVESNVDEVTWSDDAKQAMKDGIAQDVVKKFRSIEEIRAELKSTMHLRMRSDVEVMKEIMGNIVSSNSSDNEKGVALDTLEDYVHQIDNARDLNKIGGLEPIVQLLNSSNEVLQEKAANVIGGAAQSNKEVQYGILHYGGLRLLLLMLNKGKQKLTRKKGLYALSALIRGNAKAQVEVVKLKGLQSILDIVMDNSTTMSLRVKAVTLLSDLIVEQNEVMKKLVESGKKGVHEKSPLLNSLIESKWCSLLIPLLDAKDFDSKEKVIQAISLSVDACKVVFESSHRMHRLKEEVLKLRDDIKNEEDSDFASFLESLRKQLQENIIGRLEIKS